MSRKSVFLAVLFLLTQAEKKAFSQLKALISRFTCSKIVVHFTGSFQAVLNFFADSSGKKGFQPVKNRYFCIGQQKKKKAVKRTAILGHVNRLYLCLVPQKKKRTARKAPVTKVSLVQNITVAKMHKKITVSKMRIKQIIISILPKRIFNKLKNIFLPKCILPKNTKYHLSEFAH